MDFKNLVVGSWHLTLNFIGPVLLITFVQVLLMFFSFGILAPVTTAGYVHSLLRAARDGRPPEVKDLFSQLRLFFPLLVFFLVALVPVVIGFFMLVLPGFIIMAFIAYGAFYLLPLMTDRELGLFDGLKESWDMVMQPPVSEHIIIVIIYVAIISLGSYVPFAFLITQPLATFIMVGAYQEKVAAIPARPETDRGGPGAGETE
jgi:hypothetical protein